MRLKDKTALIFGAGQAPGETPAIGNGRAVSLLFAREGARVLCDDRYLDTAEETARLVRDEGGEAHAVAADVTSEDQVKAAADACVERWGRIDILHNNVGISVEGGDAPITEITTEAFDRIVAVNLRSMVYACKHVLPVMRERKSGAIVSISSMAAWEDYPWVAYKGFDQNGWMSPKARNFDTDEVIEISIAPDEAGRYLDIDGGLLVYSVGEYLLTHLYLLNLNNPESVPCQISWDNGAERPRIHNKLVIWDYYDGATGRSAIQGRDLETGLTFDIGVRDHHSTGRFDQVSDVLVLDALGVEVDPRTEPTAPALRIREAFSVDVPLQIAERLAERSPFRWRAAAEIRIGPHHARAAVLE